jgi:polysaccharide biosynthesis/export protein
MDKMKMSATKILIAVCAVTAVCLAQGVDKAPVSVASETAPAVVSPNAPNIQLQQRYPRYKIRAGDQFDVNFDLSPEFNQSVTVQPDGYVTMRGLGDLHVQDQTVPQLTETLRTAYSKILHDPIISVLLKDFEKPYFIADGQLGKPGKYDLRGDTTVTQAIAIAGGFTESSKHSQVLLFRRVSDQWTEAKIIDVKKMEKEGILKEDPFLHPGDMLFVPKNTLSKIAKYIPNANMGTYVGHSF